MSFVLTWQRKRYTPERRVVNKVKKKFKKADLIIMVVLLLVVALIVVALISDKSSDTKDASILSENKTVTAADYNGKKIGILTGTNMEAESFEHFPDSEYLYFDGYPNLNTALINGTVDAFLGDEPALKSIHAEQPQIDYIKERLTNNKYSFAFRKDDEKEKKLCDQLNEFLAKANSDGTIAEIDSIWFGADDSKKVVDMSDLTGENGTIHVITTSTDEPFSYIKDGKNVGYDIDVTVRFCREYGYALEIGDVDFQARIPALASGKYEFTTSMNVTPEREEEVMFSDPVSEGGIVVAVRAEDISSDTNANAKKTTCADFNGKRAGITTGSIHDDIIKKNLPESEIYDFKNYSDLTAALTSDRIDYFLMTEEAIEQLMAENNEIGYVDEPLDALEVGALFQKTEKGDTIRAQMDEYITKISSDGTLDSIYEYWRSSEAEGQSVDMSGLEGKNGTLIFATGGAKPPVSYVSGDNIAGSDPDIAVRFCREYGYDIDVQIVDTGGLVPGIVSGTYDFAMSDLVITEERKQSVNFSVPYNEVELFIVARKSDLNSAGNDDDVRSRPFSYYAENGKIGAVTGGLYEVEILRRFPNAEILEYNAQTDLALALSEGKIDAFTCPVSSAKDFMQVDDTLTYLDEVFMKIPYGFAFQKSDGENELRDQLNEYLAKIKSDGTYDEIVSVWFGDDESKKTVAMPEAKGSRTLRYITASTMQPYSYIKDGVNVGLEIDIIARFCNEYRYGLTIDNADFGSLIAGVSSGTYDLASGTIMITEERAQSVDFSDVYYTTDAVAVVRKESSDMQDKTSFFESLKISFEKNFIREARWKLIVQGIGTTCLITVLAVIFGSVLAFIICLFRRTDSVLSGKISDFYVKLLQGTPMVVLLMILYYVIFGRTGIAAVWVAVIGFALNFAAYTSEIMRSGIESIDPGQSEAALALGYTENQAFFKFIFPQAVVRQIPVYRGEIITLLKGTSVVGYIAIQDLTKMSDIIRSRTYEAFFPLIVTAVIYFLLAWVISLIIGAVLKCIDPRARKKAAKEAVK